MNQAERIEFENGTSNMLSSLTDNGEIRGSERSTSSTAGLLSQREKIPLKKRVTIFSLSMFGIFAEYLYYNIPMSFLANEILEVWYFYNSGPDAFNFIYHGAGKRDRCFLLPHV
jgi:hypothetical protein